MERTGSNTLMTMQKSESRIDEKKINWGGAAWQRREDLSRDLKEMKLLVTGKHSSRGNTKFQRPETANRKEPVWLQFSRQEGE